jgi:hypothetical protein
MVRLGVPRLRGFGLSLLAAAVAAACTEQQFQLGFETDTTAPTVAVALTSGDTLQVQNGIRFTVDAADNLGLRSISVALAGGFNGVLDTTFNSAVTQVSLGVSITLPPNTTAGGQIIVTATATDGNNNTASASDTLFLVNLAALNVNILQPTTGAITAAGRQVPVEIRASQSSGIRRVGYTVTGNVTGGDSVDVALPDTATFTDTLNVPAGLNAGSFTIEGFAIDSAGRRGLSAQVVVSIQSIAADSAPPMVTVTIAPRVEVRDSITVTANDPSGITLLGWLATDLAGTVIRGDSVTSSGTLTTITQRFNLNFNLATLPQTAIVRGFAVDQAGNRGESRVDISASSPAKRDTVLIVHGLTKPLRAGSRIADAIYNRNRNEVYLTNLTYNQVEVFQVTDTTFAPPINVGSNPWGIALWPRDTLGANGDTVMVANSGGTDISIVDVALRSERRRHALPNFLIQSVQTETDPATGLVKLSITEFDFSDRPQYLAATCRATGTACSATNIIAVYSTAGTPAQQTLFPGTGTVRWENLTGVAPQSHFFWEQAEVAPSPDSDTLQVIVDRGPSVGSNIILAATCGRTVTMRELGFADSTFVRNSGNFTRSLIGEGGSAVEPALGFARAMAYNVTSGLQVTACPTVIIQGVPFSGNEELDLGISPGLRVRDFIVNTAIPVRSVAVNFNGLTNMIRADSIYILDDGLRLRGILSAAGLNPGMDLNFNHAFMAGTGGTPGTSGGALSPNDRLSFSATAGPQIEVYDTYFFARIATVEIRDPVIGPLRVARLASGEQFLIGVTARGVVTARLPAITNSFPAPKGW